MKSLFLSLNLNDLLKGFIVAAFAAIGTAILPLLESGTLPTLANLGAAGIAGLTAGLAYLAKNFLSNSNNVPFATEKNAVPPVTQPDGSVTVTVAPPITPPAK
jgi:hypothetical protein